MVSPMKKVSKIKDSTNSKVQQVYFSESVRHLQTSFAIPGISSVGGVDVSSSGNTKSCVSRDASASGGGGGGGGTNSLPIKKRGHRHSRPSPSSAESPSVVLL